METILSLLSGGLLRLVPELIGLWNKKTDNSHELAMMDKQLELSKFKGADDRETIQMNGDIQYQLTAMQATMEAVKAQAQLTGVKWVDALNFLVRPLTTYYFLGCYGIYKTAMLWAAFQQTNMWSAILQSYDADDKQILFGILAFWFVGRTFDKKQK